MFDKIIAPFQDPGGFYIKGFADFFRKAFRKQGLSQFQFVVVIQGCHQADIPFYIFGDKRSRFFKIPGLEAVKGFRVQAVEQADPVEPFHIKFGPAAVHCNF